VILLIQKCWDPSRLTTSPPTCQAGESKVVVTRKPDRIDDFVFDNIGWLFVEAIEVACLHDAPRFDLLAIEHSLVAGSVANVQTKSIIVGLDDVAK
jgi:hypothetical protein